MEPDIYTLKQAIMKMDSLIQDLCELKDDDADNRDSLEIITDTATIMEAKLINLYKNKTGDDDLLSELEMEDIESFPFDSSEDPMDILDNIQIL